MTEVILVSGFFLAVQLSLLYIARTARIFVWAHAAFYVVFVPLLHLLEYLGREERPLYHIDVYVLAHSVVFGYLLGFLLWAGMLMRFMSHDTTLIRSLLHISNKTLTGILIAWVTLKVYLGMKYGPLALSGLKGEIEGAAQFRLDFYDVLLSTYLAYFAVGACVTFVLKVIISRTWPMVPHTIVFTIFLSMYLVLGEASMGARRFVLLIMLMAIAGATRSWKMPPKQLTIKLSKLVLVGLFIAIMFGMYFQTVRFNILQPEIATSLVSGDLPEMAKGALLVLIPDSDSDVETEQRPLLRTGPFELIYDVLLTQVETGSTTHGHITTSSLEMIVPYVIAGPEKTSVNVDQILVDELGIIPSGGFENPDLSGSVLAVFLADYGLIGAIIAPMATMVALLITSLMLRWARTNTLLTVLVFSILFQIAGNVEGDLLTLLTSLRDIFIGGVVIITARLAVTAMKPIFLWRVKRLGASNPLTS